MKVLKYKISLSIKGEKGETRYNWLKSVNYLSFRVKEFVQCCLGEMATGSRYAGQLIV